MSPAPLGPDADATGNGVGAPRETAGTNGDNGATPARSRSPRKSVAGPKRTPRPEHEEASDGAGPSPEAERSPDGPAPRSRATSRSATATAKAGSDPGTVAPGARPKRQRRPVEADGAGDDLVLPWERDATTVIPAGTGPGVAFAPAPPTGPVMAPQPGPVSQPGRAEPPRAGPVVERRGAAEGRRRGRRVHRVVRRIDLWSVLKLATVLYTCLYVAVLATLALVWSIAYSSGQIERIQSFLADVGLENYRFYGDQMFRAVAAIGAIGVLASIIITVLTAALVNVVSELTGGIRLVVIEEDPPPRRRS